MLPALPEQSKWWQFRRFPWRHRHMAVIPAFPHRSHKYPESGWSAVQETGILLERYGNVTINEQNQVKEDLEYV